MSTLSRKQREIKEREAKILDVARRMIVQGGYHGLNMDGIAEQLQYSKGTIYNHYSCKEEVILSLAIQTTETRTAMFERASAFHGCTRERMTAIGVAAEMFVRLYPEHFKVEQIIRSASMWDKTSTQRRIILQGCETRCVSIVAGIVRDAVSRGELVLPEHFSAEDLVFSLWSMSVGSSTIIGTSQALHSLGISDPYFAIREGSVRTLDGFGWKPHSSEFDAMSVFNRVQREVFAEESQHLE